MASVIEYSQQRFDHDLERGQLPVERVLRVLDKIGVTAFFAWSVEGSGAVYFDNADEVQQALGLQVFGLVVPCKISGCTTTDIIGQSYHDHAANALFGA
jgi:hypothetical protein